jgi:dTDP-4-dehydrorhamnose 3,5-epimerase
MGAITLNDIVITPLTKIPTSGGDVFHALKKSDPGYEGFGEAYFSWVNQDAIKAWKRHKTMTMNLVVPYGMVRFVFCVNESKIMEENRVVEIGTDNYARITVPQGVWFGFQGLSSPNSLILNISNIIHDQNEVERKLLEEIPYNWGPVK